MSDLTPLSPEEIAAAEARCQQATPGPWDPTAMFDPVHPDYVFHQYITGNFTPTWRANLVFIAHARTDLPRALVGNAQLHQLRAKMRATEAALTAVATLMDEMEAYQADNDFPTVSEYEGFFLRLRALLDEKE